MNIYRRTVCVQKGKFYLVSQLYLLNFTEVVVLLSTFTEVGFKLISTFLMKSFYMVTVFWTTYCTDMSMFNCNSDDVSIFAMTVNWLVLPAAVGSGLNTIMHSVPYVVN